MDARRVFQEAAAILLVTAATTAGSATASLVPGSPFTPGADVQVSGPSSLTGCTAGASDGFAAAYDNTEVEPQVAVNPTNPNEIVGVAQQDRWPDGGARGLSSWRSLDGGVSWSRLPDVEWSACQGGPARFSRVTDPWVSYDQAGNLYFIGLLIGTTDPAPSAISVTSFDRATQAWRAPQIIQEDAGDRLIFNDKVSITGDPTRAGYAYATWRRENHPSDGHSTHPPVALRPPVSGEPMFSRTTDGGQTWSTPVPMGGTSLTFLQGNQIAVAPDGTLYNVAFDDLGFLRSGQSNMIIMRSRDAGLHWSAPVSIAPLTFSQLVVPDDGTPIRSEEVLPDIAIDPANGDIYVAWADALGTDVYKVVLAKSTDGGRHWSGPTVVSAGGPSVQSYDHSIDVTDNGTVVLTYYDDRNNVLGDGIATTDVWVRHSHDGTQTWEPEQHLHGPFNHYTAPMSFESPGIPRGLFLGDYMGLETISGDNTIAFFASTNNDGADVRAIRLQH